MSYPGLAFIGCERLAGIYGVDEGIVDAKGTGVQHLFFDGFEHDLIHSATTLVRDGDTIFYGNRMETRASHPVHLRPEGTRAGGGYIFEDRFVTGTLERVERAFAWGDANIGFETRIRDRLGKTRQIDVYAYLISQAGAFSNLVRKRDRLSAETGHCRLGVRFTGAERHVLLEEGPTGFIYRLTGAILRDHATPETAAIGSDMHAGMAIGRRITLPANGEVTIDWTLAVANDAAGLDAALSAHGPEPAADQAVQYWEDYLADGKPLALGRQDADRANQVAIKSAMIGGFVPADLTGHYYANGLPSYYARDALMIARAFILSGHYREARQVITYLLGRARKPSEEFYQRYDGAGAPSEGANNNVFHQLDSIGYVLHVCRTYQEATDESLLDAEAILSLVRVIFDAGKKHGLAGPEGGVNEGVFGPAFIVSSNMFIYGGLRAALAMLGEHPLAGRIRETMAGILAGIETTFIPGEGYRYGYVTYHDELVCKYDTPQYFGLPYGFEDTSNMRETHRILRETARFGTHGIGYSEQEYHHGPWTFNTAACAEYSALIGDGTTYTQTLDWLGAHTNAYGLMPEAFTDDLSGCYINPLVWACAEVVSALHIKDGAQ